MTVRSFPSPSFSCSPSHPVWSPAAEIGSASIESQTSSQVTLMLPHVIVLVGLMGSGKTTLGRALAQQYDMDFIDSDYEIEQAAGCSIAEIFKRHGEAHFREGEHRVVKRLLRHRPCVLATGGGAWMDPRTRKAVEQTPGACSIWLRVPLDILYQRLRHSPTLRPLIQGKDPRSVLQNLADQRDPFYAQADITVACGANTVEHSVQAMKDAIAKLYPSPPKHGTIS